MPEIRSKHPVDQYRTIVLQAADLGISEGQYVTLIMEGVMSDQTYTAILSTRGMKQRVEAAQRRAAGVIQRLDGQKSRKGLFNGS